MRPRFVDQRRRAPDSRATRRRHRPGSASRAAEQPVERPARRLAADVPQRHVDAAHRQGGAGAHAVAGELARVDARPQPTTSVASMPRTRLAQRRVDEVGDGARRAAVMGFAPADDAVVGRHLDDHRVALDRAADAERHASLGRNGIGRGVRLVSSTIFIASSECGPRGVYVNSEGLASQCQGVSCVLTFPSCHRSQKARFALIGEGLHGGKVFARRFQRHLHHPEFTRATLFSPPFGPRRTKRFNYCKEGWVATLI